MAKIININHSVFSTLQTYKLNKPVNFMLTLVFWQSYCNFKLYRLNYKYNNNKDFFVPSADVNINHNYNYIHRFCF